MNQLYRALFCLFVGIAAPCLSQWDTIGDVTQVTAQEIEVRNRFLKAFQEGNYVSVSRDGNWAGILIDLEAVDYPIDINQWDVVWGTHLWWEYIEQKVPPVLQRILGAGELLHDLFIASPNDAALLAAMRAVAHEPQLAANDRIRTMKLRLSSLLTDLAVGYPVGTLERYPDCKAFFEANQIGALAQLYGHQFQITAEGEPMIRYQGELASWREVAALVPLREDGTMRDHVYSLQGIELGSPSQELRLIVQGGKPLYGNRHVIEVRSSKAGEQLFDFWLRLYYPNGDVYSIGWEPIPPQFQLNLGVYTVNWILGFGKPDQSALLRAFHRRTGLPFYRGQVISPALEERNLDAKVIAIPVEVTTEQMAEAVEFLRASQKFPDAIGGSGRLGSAVSRYLVYLVLSEAGVSPCALASLDTQENWAQTVADWRAEQLKILKARGAGEAQLDQIRFSLPTLKIDF